MPVAATIPVAVSPEAEARLAELGLRPQVERMVAYAREHLPEVSHIDVVLNERHDLGGEPGIAVDVYSNRPYDPQERISWNLGTWAVEHFAPEVLEHLHLAYYPGLGHGR